VLQSQQESESKTKSFCLLLQIKLLE